MNLPELLNKYDIVRIPRLQRDYAHGRNDALSSEIRTELLKDIFTKPELSLNVVFGECVAGGDKKIFMPIDGQQRITTLFLCYLYGWKMLGTENPKLERFSYETRHSTVDFLKELTGREWPYELINSKGGISSAIMDQNWFAWPLQYDPTAVGMLTMLDAIHQMCKSYPFPELDAIEFDFLDIGEMGLNETLYLKMNSRGKQLTPFEKIKSGLDGLSDGVALDTESLFFDRDEEITLSGFADHWRWNMDRKWSDWFWNKLTHEQDQYFLNLISMYSIAFYVNEERLSVNSRSEYVPDSKLNVLLDKKEETVTWYRIKNLLEINGAVDHARRQKYFEGMAKMLNRLIRMSGTVSGTFRSSWGYVLNLRELSDRTNRNIALVWGIACFSGESYESDSFQEWMRVIFNLVCNMDDGFDPMARFIKRCGSLYAHESSQIYAWLSSEKADEVQDRSEQWQEERIKARVLCRSSEDYDENKAKVILNAEAHNLFQGRIRPLLLSSDCETISTDDIEKKWTCFNELFDDEHARESGAADTFRIVFSYCDLYEDLWWNRYVFQNSSKVWKDGLFALKNFYHPIYHLFNGDGMNDDITSPAIKTLCSPHVMEKVLACDRQFYVREPDISLRPYGDMWNGIRLRQDRILASVKNLLKIDGLDFRDSYEKQFFHDSKESLVWGVRMRFLYRDRNLQLWDDYRLRIDGGFLKDGDTEIRLFDCWENLKSLIDSYIDSMSNNSGASS